MAVGNTIGKLTAEPMVPKSTPAGSANPPEKKSWWSKWGDAVHTGLDILGAVPVIGIVADGANAAIYAAEGDYVNAAISGASAAANLIPGGGAAMKAGKAAVAVGKQAAKTVAKEGAEVLVETAAKQGGKKVTKEVAEEGAEQAAKKAGSDAGGGVKGKGKKKKPCKNKPKVGKPVNPVLGIKFLSGREEVDFDLPAPLPLPWQRSYFSDQLGNGWLGQGWSLPLSWRLLRSPAGLLLVDEQGRETELSELDEGGSELDRYEGIRYSREANGRYRVNSLDCGLQRIFAPLELDSADPLGERAVYFPLVAIEDRNGNRIRIFYGEDGLPAQIIDAANRQLSLNFAWRVLPTGKQAALLTQVALLREVPDNQGTGQAAAVEVLVRYAYSEDGDLAQVYGRDGALWRTYAYRNHILVEHCVPGGLTSRYEYDQYTPAGRVLEHTTSVGEHWRFHYEQGLTRVVDVVGREVRYEYNTDEELTAVVDASGGRTQIELNAWGKPTAIIDPSGRATRYRYDAQGYKTAIIDPAGGRTEIEWDERWQLPSAIVDPTGARTQFAYDAAGNLVRKTDSLGHVTAYNHDERGLVVRVTDARGGKRTIDYDAFGQPLRHSDCLGRITLYEWDVYGRRVAQTQADGARTTFRYDARDNLLCVEYPDGSSDRYDYDEAGRLVRHVDAQGRESRYELHDDGLPRARIDALGHRLLYQYDASRRLVVLTNENGRYHRYAYDERNNIVAEQGFDGRVTRYYFDPSDHLVERRELGTRSGPGVELPDDNVPELLRTQYQRDAAGRIVEKVVARARDKRVVRTCFAYDPAGRVVEATADGSGTVQFTYDDEGRVVEQTTVTNGRTRAVQHQYDVLGNRIGTLLPDGRALRQEYYGPGYLHRISLDGDVLSEIERDAMQRETVRSQGALKSYFDYDVMGRRVEQHARKDGIGAQDQVARRYVYDRVGNLEAMSDRRFGQTIYAYDALDRLTRANTERFAFDPAHNLVEGDGAAWPDNRVTRYEDKRFAYDTHGNVVEKRIGDHTAMQFSYDPEHRLESVSIVRNGIKQNICYGYDALGRRSWKRDSFGTTEFVWDGNRLLQEVRNSRCLTYVYEPDGFVPLAQVESTQTADGAETSAHIHYFHNDQIGLPRELSDKEGRITWRANYRAWGNTLLVENPEPDPARAEPVHQPLRFQGQYFDAETGLHYNCFRYYDPDIGRFVSQDPIGLFGGINTYQYAPNPAGWTDPLGLSTSSDAEILAKNLTDCGSARPSSRHKAHHIVMSNSNDPKMKALREKMGKNGLDIDINDARNGVWLPETSGDRLPGSTKTAHKGEGVHGQDYKNKVYQKLMGAKNQDEFYKGLAELKSDLEGGTTYELGCACVLG
ncbi:MAG: RHS domain-containing protein [Rhodanobacteraceae bacterium]|nr:RHS domain-containing protein [Rhodanobacteraceae bacterium]